jgi:type VI protein secretion system component Hcp
VTKTLAALILIVSLATFAAAEGAPGQEKKAGPEGSNSSTITITAAGLSCTTALGTGIFSATAYSFGATNPLSTSTGGGGGGTGKATIMPLSVTKLFDECSPALFGAVATGQRIKTVDLTQNDNKGKPVLTINLQDAAITSYQIGGSEASDSPRETILIDFAKICVANPSNSSKACFDRTTNTTF